MEFERAERNIKPSLVASRLRLALPQSINIIRQDWRYEVIDTRAHIIALKNNMIISSVLFPNYKHPNFVMRGTGIHDLLNELQRSSIWLGILDPNFSSLIVDLSKLTLEISLNTFIDKMGFESDSCENVAQFVAELCKILKNKFDIDLNQICDEFNITCESLVEPPKNVSDRPIVNFPNTQRDAQVSSSEAQTPVMFSRIEAYCTESDRNGSREQVAGSRNLNCQLPLNRNYSSENLRQTHFAPPKVNVPNGFQRLSKILPYKIKSKSFYAAVVPFLNKPHSWEHAIECLQQRTAAFLESNGNDVKRRLAVYNSINKTVIDLLQQPYESGSDRRVDEAEVIALSLELEREIILVESNKYPPEPRLNLSGKPIYILFDGDKQYVGLCLTSAIARMDLRL